MRVIHKADNGVQTKSTIKVRDVFERSNPFVIDGAKTLYHYRATFICDSKEKKVGRVVRLTDKFFEVDLFTAPGQTERQKVEFKDLSFMPPKVPFLKRIIKAIKKFLSINP